MKLNKISADMVSRRPDQTAEWLNRLSRQVDIIEAEAESTKNNPYTLPIASAYTLGAIKVGANLSITPEGVLSALSPSSYNYELLFNKPKINSVELVGNKSLSDLGIDIPTKTSALLNDGSDGVHPFIGSDDLATQLALKQDVLTQTQLNAVNSGIDATKVTQIATNADNITSNTGRITTIENKIPSAATSSNKLTDKNYVDNAIATNSANYISDNGHPFQSLADLQAYSGPLTNNDYAFVVSTDAQGNTIYTRYKYNASAQTWAEEYSISNPTFSSTQWAAIDSGVTANDVSQIGTNKTDIAGLQTSKQDKLTAAQQAAVDSGIDATKVTKLNGIEAGAEVNVQSDWNEADSSSDAYIKNKPTIPTVNDATLTIKRNGTTAQTFTANSSTDKNVDIQAPVRVNLQGQVQTGAWRRSVIALCAVTTADKVEMDSFSSGKITFHRNNGLAGMAYIDVYIENAYNGAYAFNFSYTSNVNLLSETAAIDTATGFRPCVFKKDNVWYAGIEVYLAAANYHQVVFDGETNFGIFGVDYYSAEHTSGGTSYPAEVLDQEVYDSLDYTKVTYIKGTIMARSFRTEEGTIKKQGYTATLPNKTGTLAMTSDINDATLKIQKNGTDVASFTANSSTGVTANISVPTKTSDITNDGADGTSTYVENDDLTTALAGKQDTLTAGANITINGSTISATDTTYPVFTGATSGTAGASGLVPAPVAGDDTKYLSGDGLWKTVSQYSLPIASDTTLGGVKIGNNLTIDSLTGVLDATDTTYSAGSGITLAGTTFSADTSVMATNEVAQDFAVQEGSTQPVFEGMTPVQTFEWDVSDTVYRPIYQIDNTGWDYTNMDITVAYRITVTGTGIKSVTDVIDRWFNPISWPLTSALHKTLSTSAGTTGFRYLRAVYPTAAYLNNTTYPIGQEIYMYNGTARHVLIEVFKTNSNVTWNTTKPSESIYKNSTTYQSTNSVEIYATRGWHFRKPANFIANNADAATRISDYEPTVVGNSAILNGPTALVAGHLAFLAEDGKVYDISDTTKAISVGEAKMGFLAAGINANAAMTSTYWRAIFRPNSTQYGFFNHDTMALGDRVYLRCTMDSSGKIYSDNYLAKNMAPGYTWMPMGMMTASNTFYADVRFPMFYTLNSVGKITHVNGRKTTPDITITDTDPGEGVSLGEDEYIAVYGDPEIIGADRLANGAVTAAKIDFSTLNFGNYSNTEQDTGFTWVDGSKIYKKTIIHATGLSSGSNNIPHGISDLGIVVNKEIIGYDSDTSTTAQIPMATFTSSTPSGNSISAWTVTSTNVQLYSSFAYANTVYITLYYTKNI